jgi:DNA polymerase III subunit epsilon
MLEDLHLERPLVCFDIESTGTSVKRDRVIDLAMVKVHPGGREETREIRVNPGMPIPSEASAIHGLYDADVKDCPPFADVAGEVDRFLADCDLCGYNLLRFDIPLLQEEMNRAGIPWTMDGRRVIDAQRIFHRKEPRDLTAALKFYCGELHLGAHGATADVRATLSVLEGQLRRYGDLPRDLAGLDAYCHPRDPTWADESGRLKWRDGVLVINFGRNEGASLRELARDERGFLQWILDRDFPDDTKALVREALKGKFPDPPTVPPGGAADGRDAAE